MRRELIVLVVAIVLGGTTTGCDFIKKFAEKAKEQAETKQQDNADGELGDKLNKYIPCINITSSSVGRASDFYHRWLDDVEKGPSGKERAVNGTLEISSIDTCKDNIEQGEKLKPELEKLEKAADKWLAAVEKVDKLNSEAYKYYKQGNYKDDGFKKGKELHPKLHEAFEKFFEQDKKFRAAFSEEKKELDQRELDRLEREGQKLAYAQKKFMLAASELIDMGKEAEVPDLGNLELKPFEKLLKKAEDAFDEMDKAATGAEKKKVTGWDSYASAAAEFMRASKDLARRKRENKPFTQAELQQLNGPFPRVEGSPQVMLEKFNEMVNKSNFLRWM